MQTLFRNCFNQSVISFITKLIFINFRIMEDNIMLILHHGGGLERDEYQRLQYVHGEFCVWEKMDVGDLCLWDIAEITSWIKLIFVYIIQGLI
jgi:hypothetical protein